MAIYCGECGTENPDRKTYCWKCGNKLYSVPVATQAEVPIEKPINLTIQDVPKETEPHFDPANVPPQIPKPTNQQRQLVPAPSVSRIAAFVIDALIIWVIAVIFLLYIRETPVATNNLIGIPLFYYFISWTLLGTSIGKGVLSLHIVKLDGASPGIFRAFARCFVMILFSALWITWWTVPFRRDRRALHDLVAGTMVVKKESELNQPLRLLGIVVSIIGLTILYNNSQAVSTSVTSSIQSVQNIYNQLQSATLNSSSPSLSVTATTTPLELPTSTSSQSGFPTTTAGSVLIENFLDNRNGWQLVPGKAYLENNALHIKPTEEGLSLYIPCQGCGNYSDFSFESTISRIEGSEGYSSGMIFRAVNGRNFYVFSVYPNAAYSFQKLVDGQWQRIIGPTPSNSIFMGNDRNIVRVIAKGSKFDFYINSRFVDSATDNTFSSGLVGVGVGAAGIHIAVDKVRIE